MKICIECQCEFKEKSKIEKYCTLKCSKTFYHKKEMHRRRTDEVYRKARNQKEIARRHLKRQTDKNERLKHNAQEKERKRKKIGILSDSDLKYAPKGSGTLNKHGYRQIIKHGHPNSWRNGGIFEHVFIISEYLKRPLHEKETVHHKNGIKDDNRIENLELWSHSHPHGQRVEDKIEWCKEFLTLYGYSVIKKEN